MNLWVRSQYKEMLFKVNNNLIIDIMIMLKMECIL